MSKKANLASDPELGPVTEEDFEEKNKETKGKDVKEFGRKKYIIDSDFQYKFSTTWVFTQILYISLVFLPFYFATRYIEVKSKNPVVDEQLTNLLIYTGLFVGATTLFFGLYYMLLAHRIAGPAYRLTESLKRMARGDFDFQVHLRKTDYLKNVAETMNTTLNYLSNRKKHLSEISKKVETIQNGLEEDENREDLTELCEEIQEDVDALMQHKSRGNSEDHGSSK